MTARHHVPYVLAGCVGIGLLAVAYPARASAQSPERAPRSEQGRDTTAASRAASDVKDLRLTAAERQRYVGTYATELPGGEKVTLRVSEDGTVLRLWVSEPETTVRLFYQGDQVFRMEGAPFVLAFTVLHDVAVKFDIRKPEGTLVAVRTR